MLRRIALSAALAVSLIAWGPSRLLAAGTAGGLAVPEALQGAWYGGRSCSEVSSYIFRGDGWFVGITERADSGTIVANSWVFSVLRVGPDGSAIVSSYWPDRATGAFGRAKLKITPSGSGLEGSYLSPAAAAQAAAGSEVRCDNPEVAGKPWPLAADYLAGLTGILVSASAVQKACKVDTHACADAVIAALDLNHDGKISKAELVSLFRRAAKLGLLIGKVAPGTTMMHAEFTLDQVTGAEFGAAVIGPVFASIVMSNIDYNGDGFIEENELETFLRQIGMPPGRGLLGQVVGSAIDSADQAARSLGALQQLLGAFGGH